MAAAAPPPETVESDVEKGCIEFESSSEEEEEVEEKEKEVRVVEEEVHRDTVQAEPSRLRTQFPVPPIQVVSHGAEMPTSGADAGEGAFQSGQTPSMPSLASLNSRTFTNRITLFLFILHILGITAAVSFLSFKAVEGLLDPTTSRARRERRILRYWLPPIEGATILGAVLGFVWQRAVRWWPAFMVRFILWSTFGITMVAGLLLIGFSLPATDGIGVALVLFSIGTSFYACWATRRTVFTCRAFERALRPAAKFRDLEGPAYLMLVAGFLWTSVWLLAVIGALNFYYPPLTILALVVSLAWTAEVIRNVANLTVSRVVALYYLRGMQSSTQFSFIRAISRNLGSACLGSLFVPAIEALRILARGLNLLETEDEFMFCCAHCCLNVMESVFRYGNSWAFVHIAAYGKGFVAASRSTWDLFQREQMEKLVDSDMTSSICFLTGVSSGSLCLIFAASWTFATHRPYTPTVSLLSFYVGYLMTRIAMALPHACVECYYVCYAENPKNRLFDSTIPDQLKIISEGRDVVSTPRFPRRHAIT